MENGIANIERAEVEEAVGRITLWKAAGADDISPELIKFNRRNNKAFSSSLGR
jgi:hypothetical protein